VRNAALSVSLDGVVVTAIFLYQYRDRMAFHHSFKRARSPNEAVKAGRRNKDRDFNANLPVFNYAYRRRTQPDEEG
jgi:hypothetical protein